MWLATYSIIVGLFGIVFKNPSLLLPSNFFHGYTIWSWTAVILLAVGGLIIAMVLKYADNILKAFGNSVSILVSSWISVYLFNFVISTNFFLGCALVMGAIVLYSMGSKKVTYSPLPVKKCLVCCHIFVAVLKSSSEHSV